MKGESKDVFSYRDARAYLRDAIGAAKAGSPSLNLSRLAVKAGFRSPSSLSMLLNGKRPLRPHLAERVGEALGLTGKRKAYLVALARRASARSAEEALAADAAIDHLTTPSRERLLEPRQYRLMTEWYYPVIYVLVGMSGFGRSSRWISRRLRGSVSPSQVRQAIGDLLHLGLIKEKDGKLVQAHEAVTTAEDPPVEAVALYHRRMLPFASAALDMPRAAREFNALVIGIPKRRLEEVKAKIRKLRHELNESLSQSEDAEEVYHISFQLYPVTRSVAEPPTEDDL